VTTIVERVATSLLAVSGRQAISDLYDAAIIAAGLGKLDVADSLVAIAKAVERVALEGAPATLSVTT
jgi:DUF1009 family protein